VPVSVTDDGITVADVANVTMDGSGDGHDGGRGGLGGLGRVRKIVRISCRTIFIFKTNID